MFGQMMTMTRSTAVAEMMKKITKKNKNQKLQGMSGQTKKVSPPVKRVMKQTHMVW